MRHFTILLAPLLLISAVAAQSSDDYYVALDAYDRGDYETALRLWEPLAEDGEADAQYRLGRLYETGVGGTQNDALALDWYRRGAEQGHARAQNNLGLMLDVGRGGPEDNEAAVKWYRRAAAQGRAVAQHNLASMYERGEGVPQQLEEAARWYRIAAGGGHPGSQHALASMYEQGRGVTRDEAKAASWYRKAAKRDHAPSQHRLAVLYEAGRGVAQDREKAVKWYRRTAVNGSDEARRRLDELALGHPTPLQPAPALVAPPAPPPEPVVEATTGAPPVEQTPVAVDPEEQYRLGRRYLAGDGLPPDAAKAEQWLLAAARQGHAMATYRLAFLYLRGQGASARRELVQAYAWLSIAAQDGTGDAEAWREKTARKLTAQELGEAEALSRTLRRTD